MTNGKEPVGTKTVEELEDHSLAIELLAAQSHVSKSALDLQVFACRLGAIAMDQAQNKYVPMSEVMKLCRRNADIQNDLCVYLHSLARRLRAMVP